MNNINEIKEENVVHISNQEDQARGIMISSNVEQMLDET